MNYFREFFTHTETATNFKNYGLIHICIIFIALACMRWCYKKDYSEKFERNMIILIALNQIILYLWYFTGPDFIDDGLPLYTCRIADILLVIAFLCENKFLRALGVYLGFVGGVVAVATPALYRHSLLHYSNIDFFVSHIALMSLSMYYFMHDKEGYFVSMRNRVMKYTFFILIIVAIINKILGTNYSYTVNPPFLMSVFDKMHWITYFIIMLGLYEFSIIIQSILFEFFEKRRDILKTI